ncbi:response regulator transcription factor [Nonomuraea sp. NPDC004297]
MTMLTSKVDNVKTLTPREAQVLGLLGIGANNRQIAQELDITERTVRFHITAILAKLAVSSRTEAAIVALTDDLLRNARYDTTAGSPPSTPPRNTRLAHA